MRNITKIKNLTIETQDLTWGLTINIVGYESIQTGSPYSLTNHSNEYLLSQEEGYLLKEYQLVYITKGEGVFESSHHAPVKVKAGDMFMLFPSECHSYKPDKQNGWDGYWIGFKGVNMDNRIEHQFFSKKNPILQIGINNEVIRLYEQALTIAEEKKSGYQQMLGGIVNMLLGYAYSLNKEVSPSNERVTNQINKAKIIILSNFAKKISPESISEQICMSYSSFRQIFKKQIGIAPSQYIQELRIEKSKDLLLNTLMTSQEIAFEVGFEYPDYFCRLFKKRTGYTPIAYRESYRR